MPSRVPIVGFAGILMLLVSGAACGSMSAAPPVPPSTTHTVPVTAPAAPTCPPGCAFASDHDALTVLASSANQVAIVQEAGGAVTTVRVLQGDPHGLPAAPPGTRVRGDMLAPGLTDGHSYIVFTSYDRGGTCVSALFRYDPRTEVAAFLYDRDGYEAGRILLAGRTLTVPATATLAGLRRHLDPTGGVIYPSDVSESLCPGP